MSANHRIALVRGGCGSVVLLLPMALLFGGEPIFSDLSKMDATLLIRLYFIAGMFYTGTWYLLWVLVCADWNGLADAKRKASQ